MEIINNLTFDLKQKYCETRELQKKITVSLAQLEQSHQESLLEISKIVQDKIMVLKKYQKQLIKEIQVSKANTLSIVYQQLDNFRDYAKQIRKLYLGGNSNDKIPHFKLQNIRQYLQLIESSKGKLHSFVKQANQYMINDQSVYQESSTNRQKEFLGLNAFTIKSQRLVDKKIKELSFQISPIKKKGNIFQPEKDYNLSKFETSTNKQLLSHTIIKSQIQHNQAKSIKFQSPLNQKQKKEVPQIKINEGLKRFQGFNLSQQRNQQGKRNKIQQLNSVRSNKTRLSKVKSQQKIDGYKNCLKILQSQQLKYDRIKQGIN